MTVPDPRPAALIDLRGLPLQTHTLFGVEVRTRLPFGAVRMAASLYLAGDVCTDICDRVGIRPVMLRQLMIRLGIARTASEAMRLTQSRRHGRDYARLGAEAVRLYCDERMTGQQVGDLLDISPHTVYAMVRAAGRRVRSYSSARLLSHSLGRDRLSSLALAA